MKDKNSILAEARQKAEEKLEKLRPKAMLYTLFGIGFGIITGIVGSLITARFFPVNLVLLLVIPIVAYITTKRHVRQHILHYANDAIKALSEEPQDDRDYWCRADILSSYGFHEAAVDDYRLALEIEPNEELNSDIWYDLAHTLWELRRRDEALPIVEKLIAKKGDYHGLALVLQGKILAEEDPAAALKCFDKAIEIEPKYFYHRLSRIRFFLDLDRLDEAAEMIEQTAKMLKWQGNVPHIYAEFYEFCGELALKQGRFADAVREFTIAIRWCSSEAKYYRLRGDAHEALGDFAKAEADRSKAEKLAGQS